MEFGKELNKQIKEEQTYMLHKYLFGEPIIPNPPKNFVILVYSNGSKEHGGKKISVGSKERACDVIEKSHKKYCIVNKALSKKSHTKFVLKVRGFQDFIFGEELLENFDYIRRCMSNGDSNPFSFLL